jgi:hypothetical protein
MVVSGFSRLAGAACALLLSAGMGFAATLDVTHFARSDYAAAKAALDAFQAGTDGSIGAGQRLEATRTEDFEGFQAWNGTSGAANPTTQVGRFSSLGGVGTGGSAVNGGTGLQVRHDNPWVWGRFNTAGVDGKWLDSNDTLGMRWEVSGLGKFNALAFLLTDVADVGAVFSIKVGETLFSSVVGAGGRTENGSVQLVRILLPETVSSLVVELRNDRLNDGFGIDGATIAHVAPVPVPPAALLLLSGGLALAGLKARRRRKDAAPAA